MAASKVPKFGAWAEGGENYTVYFDNARKKKSNGQIINPNDPEDNPEMFQRNVVQPQASRADPKGQKTKVPQFGAWDNGENVGYTEYFENARKTKSGDPNVSVSEPQMNRDIQPRKDPHASSAPSKQEARSKVPQFGEWEDGGDAGYTQSFENVRKNKNGRSVNPEPSDAPNVNRGGGGGEPQVKEGRPKVPQFGAWDGGEETAYTAYFENTRKNKNVGPVLDPVDPQLNRDVNDRARPPSAGGPRNNADQMDNQLRNASQGSNSSENGSRYGKQNPGGQSPLHQKGGKLQQKAPASRGSQNPERGAAIPQWGGWKNDPQAEGFTSAFTRAKEEKNTPLNQNIPPRYNQQSNKQDDTKGCCFGWF